jgi:prepilin-type N-terminal cleavage/methylation domain-containing protein
MNKKKTKGFTLIEVLIAFVILVVTYTTLLYLHSNALHTFKQTSSLFTAVSKLELYLAGKEVEGVKVERHTFKVEGMPIIQETYTYSQDNVTAYFRCWKLGR